MSKQEIVVIVSRAIAVLLAVPALIGLVLLVPSLATTAYMRTTFAGGPAMWARMSLTVLLVPLLNAGLHITAAALFWFCGPTAERILLPIPTQGAGDTAS